MLYFKNLMAALPFLLLTSTVAHADHSATVKDAWIADAPPIAKIRAAYLTLSNQGKHTIEVKSFTSPDFTKIELHKTMVADGMVKMEEIKHLSLKSGDSIEFKPGGFHLMLFNPKRKLKTGDNIKFQMQLMDDRITEFTAVVRKRGDKGNNMENHEHHHH